MLLIRHFAQHILKSCRALSYIKCQTSHCLTHYLSLTLPLLLSPYCSLIHCRLHQKHKMHLIRLEASTKGTQDATSSPKSDLDKQQQRGVRESSRRRSRIKVYILCYIVSCQANCENNIWQANALPFDDLSRRTFKFIIFAFKVLAMLSLTPTLSLSVSLYLPGNA